MDMLTSQEGKEILKLIRADTLPSFLAKEALLRCFHTIKEILPIIRERASMDCFCENQELCTCGKGEANRILKALKERPKAKESKVCATWTG